MLKCGNTEVNGDLFVGMSCVGFTEVNGMSSKTWGIPIQQTCIGAFQGAGYRTAVGLFRVFVLLIVQEKKQCLGQTHNSWAQFHWLCFLT